MNTNLALKFEPDYTDEALAFGKGNIIQSIKDDYTKLGLIGEDHNKLMCYLAAVSRKMDTPLLVLQYELILVFPQKLIPAKGSLHL